PCLNAIPKLNGLQEKYHAYGLEVVGVACEQGTLDEQVVKVRGVRGRLGMSYPVLMGGGSKCPVQTQFQVSKLPTLVLVDEAGKIVWRSEGLDQAGLNELEREIYKQLGLRAR